MPSGDYMFRGAKVGFFDRSVEEWTRNGGAAQANNDFRCLFLGAGAQGILDADDIEDSATIGAITGLAACEYDGANYPAKGYVIIGRTVTYDSLRKHGKCDATDISIAALGPGTLVPSFNNLLIYWQPNSGVLANGIPLQRIDLGQTYTGQNALFEYLWSPLGAFYSQ